jgi:hypothetical protein
MMAWSAAVFDSANERQGTGLLYIARLRASLVPMLGFGSFVEQTTLQDEDKPAPESIMQ